MNQIRHETSVAEAEAELEHISGLAATLQRSQKRFEEVENREPYDRIAAFRENVAKTRDEFDQTVERTKRWGPAWDRSWQRLIRARLAQFAVRIPDIARIVLGFIFFLSGVNGFFPFFSMPPMPVREAAFIQSLMASGYVFPVLFATYIVAGAALLVGRFVPLALVLLAPAIVNIFCLHMFLAPAGLPLAAVLTALEIFLAWRYRVAYAPLMRARYGR